MDQSKLAEISTAYLKEVLSICDNDNEKVAGVVAANVALLVSIHKIDINAIFDALALAVDHLENLGIVKGIPVFSPTSTTLQ